VATPRVHELFAQVMSGRFVPDTSQECSILVLTPQSLSIDIPDSSKHAQIWIY
jgi:hypothetical protein